MIHSFELKDAKKFGEKQAILIQHFRFWIIKNKANNKHFHEGRTWTYNSQEALSKIFPYWSRQQIQRLIAKMKKQGIIVTGNFSEDQFDKTTWFSFKNEAQMLNGHYDCSISNNGRNIDCSISNNGAIEVEQSITGIEHTVIDKEKCESRAQTNEPRLFNIEPSGLSPELELDAKIDHCLEMFKTCNKNSKIRTAAKTNRSPIRSLLSDGWTTEEIRSAIRWRFYDLKGTDYMHLWKPKNISYQDNRDGYIEAGQRLAKWDSIITEQLKDFDPALKKEFIEKSLSWANSYPQLYANCRLLKPMEYRRLIMLEISEHIIPDNRAYFFGDFGGKNKTSNIRTVINSLPGWIKEYSQSKRKKENFSTVYDFIVSKIDFLIYDEKKRIAAKGR